MTVYKSDFLNEITTRGFFHQCTDIEALDQKASRQIIPAYIGFDCTAESLHVGSLLPIMLLRWLQKTGHKPIVLMGGGTTKVGDPSGKDESRPLLTDALINKNLESIKKIFSKYLKFGNAPTDAIMVNNDDWLKNIDYIDFLREYGPHFTINRMLSFDSVKLRLEREQPLTFLEFNYMILQAYDFLELSRRSNCIMQMGGSDQWGNIINGVELGRRADGKQLFGLTTPLMTTSSGAKMGKTAEGAIWLDSKLLPAYNFWQYWRNTEDEDIGKFLRLFTELSVKEIESLEKLKGSDTNEAKKILANEATKLCHGQDAAALSAKTALETFEGFGTSKDLPAFKIHKNKLQSGIPAFELFKLAFNISGGESRRLIKGKGAKINDIIIYDEVKMISNHDLDDDGVLKLSIGKKRHILIKPID
ncbi:MAG: tyrosine--tRNA ligase [Rhodospirillaceae bacterium]|nr:tyrosine--tRNA ligase [Rhodospirillaceae bacterium]OUT80648.1 MAG: tyrosine--tRNA ligase [Rhodospirillaceae bacterium TMED23]|tara:strand:- start:32423 stop:33676 length:1254 start_codon:yes stop_codon:yes gene_type:complete